MTVRVIKIPDGTGKDPDECLKKNTNVWARAVEGAQDIMEWYMQKAFTGRSLQDPRQLQLAVNEIFAEIVLIPFAVEREHWLKELSGRVGIEVEVLRENLVEVKKNQKTVSGSSSFRGLPKNQPNRDSVESSREENKKKATRLSLLVERLFALALRFPQLARAVALDDDKLGLVLSTPLYRPLYEGLKKGYSNGNSI